MRIEKIHWLSEAAQEAEVRVTAGSFAIEAFCQPCDVSVGQELDAPLHIFGIRGGQLVSGKEVGARKIHDERLEQFLVADIVDVESQMLGIGEIRLVVDDYLPGGLSNGDRIEFECARVDLW